MIIFLLILFILALPKSFASLISLVSKLID